MILTISIDFHNQILSSTIKNSESAWNILLLSLEYLLWEKQQQKTGEKLAIKLKGN